VRGLGATALTPALSRQREREPDYFFAGAATGVVQT
jgi:hypothetical protein